MVIRRILGVGNQLLTRSSRAHIPGACPYVVLRSVMYDGRAMFKVTLCRNGGAIVGERMRSKPTAVPDVAVVDDVMEAWTMYVR